MTAQTDFLVQLLILFAELVKLLESYMTKVNDGEGYTSWQCLACHKIFKRKHNCKEHIEAHHLKGAVEHKCSICPGTYSTEASYRQHMRNKHTVSKQTSLQLF